MRARIEITFDPKTVFAESNLPDAKDGDLFNYLLNELNAHGIQTTITAAKGCADTPASTKNWPEFARLAAVLDEAETA